MPPPRKRSVCRRTAARQVNSILCLRPAPRPHPRLLLLSARRPQSQIKKKDLKVRPAQPLGIHCPEPSSLSTPSRSFLPPIPFFSSLFIPFSFLLRRRRRLKRTRTRPCPAKRRCRPTQHPRRMRAPMQRRMSRRTRTSRPTTATRPAWRRWSAAATRTTSPSTSPHVGDPLYALPLPATLSHRLPSFSRPSPWQRCSIPPNRVASPFLFSQSGRVLRRQTSAVVCESPGQEEGCHSEKDVRPTFFPSPHAARGAVPHRVPLLSRPT